MPTLLTNGSATGDWHLWPGGAGQFRVEGTFNGATITLETRGPNGTAISMGAGGELTEPGVVNFSAPGGSMLRAGVDGSPSGIYADAVPF